MEFKFLHEYFLQKAEVFPDKTAITSFSYSLTFKQLSELSDEYSLFLQEKGLKPGQLVLMKIHTSPPAIALMLGVSKAGGVFAFVNPDCPRERLNKIIEISDPSFFISDQDSLRHDPYITDIKLNTDKLELRSFASYSRVPFEGMNLAYIVFTSGSTGEPKGIQMSHKATISFFKGLKSFETNAEEIIGSTAPLQFDLSLIDLGTALPVGCSLVQIPNILVHYPPKFVEFCNNNRVSQIHGVPSIWYEFLNHYPQLLKEFKYLKRVVFGGEDFPYNHLRLMEENLPSIDFIQAFGQSESIACAYKIMRSPLPFWQNKLPVGKGFDNNILLLVSEEGEIVREQGVPGELYISGDFLFSGYLKNVRKTEEVLFETERFTGLKQKYFKTGDLLVIGPDDEYFFIRRKDSQVKYLGNRIELEEIEGVLNSDKNVSLATVVLAPEPHPGLVAFVILKDDSGIEEKENRLRDSCASKLPPYMIPSRFIFVDRLNVTANGKIDKKSLILELQ